ncbi:MAG: DNA recombination protein RmuC [Paracoccaceae bacterium]|nr:DNA recombination protein RmuC [Paracoccaceae bacterium]
MDIPAYLIVSLALVVAAMAVALGLRGRGSGTAEAERTEQMIRLQALIETQMSTQMATQMAALAETNRTLNERLDQVSKRLGDGISLHTEKTGESLSQLKERLVVIDSAQKSLNDLSTQVVGLQDILSNKQTRGAFGETRLNDLIADALPQGSYETQSTLSNGKRADCLVKLPNPPGSVAIDSKFPLEAYRRMTAAATDDERTIAARAFSTDVTKHIRDVADKYIIPGETADWALMFVPSEVIYAELHGTFPNVVEDAHRRRVAVVSPNTLMAALTTVRAVLKDARMQEHAQAIQNEVQKLLDDVGRLDDRVGKMQRHFDQAGEDMRKVRISTEKITQRGEQIETIQLGDASENEPKGDGPAIESDNVRPIRPA